MKLATVNCPLEEGHRRAGKRLTDLSITVPISADKDDFVWTWYSEALVRDHVLHQFRAQGLSGFQVKPVQARFKNFNEGPPPRLSELVVVGWAGMALAESGIKTIARCDACGHTVYSSFTNAEKLIDESQWDGSDFFIVWPLPRYILVTERVVRLIRDNHMTGVVVRPIRDLRCATNALTPGRLSYVVPEEYASKYGKPLGIY
jgi:hypothetical protein